jgi:hypothetical protein
MIEPHRFYRKYKCIVDWFDDDLKRIISTRKTMDLGTVQDFEELADDRFTDGKKRIYVRYNTNTPSQILRISYEEFDKVHEEFLAQIGRLDARSAKKKLSYNGPIKTYFDQDKSYMISTMYPKGFDFSNKSPDQVQDGMLAHIITPFS